MIILQITEEKKEKLNDLVEGIKAMAMRLDECWDGLEWNMPEPEASSGRMRQPMMDAGGSGVHERYYDHDRVYEERMKEPEHERRVYRSGEGYVDSGYSKRY